MAGYTLIPTICIRPGLVYTYDIPDSRFNRSDKLKTIHNQEKPTVKGYTGLLTKSSRKRLINAINLLIAISRRKKAIHFDSKKEFWFRVNFITLTLPAPQREITDQMLKSKCLKPWLEYWQDHTNQFAYVWRAERQANGNLHFHLLSNQYIHYKDIRETWNRYLNRFHFINEFEANHRHRQPNSTDVHAVKQVKNLAAYIAKYMSKKEKEGQVVQGRVWDCSVALKKKEKCAWIMSTTDFDSLKEIFETNKASCFVKDYCSGVQLSETEMASQFSSEWILKYKTYLESVRESLPQKKQKISPIVKR